MSFLAAKDLVPGARMRLFCVPHAGSGAAVFRRWKRRLPAGVDLCPVMLPGRETRLGEPLAEHAAQLTAHLLAASRAALDVPYAILGHSMGALLAYSWAAAIEAAGLPAPRVLFVSGRDAAHLPYTHRGLHRLEDAAFLEALQQRFGGMPAGFLEDAELREVFLPILRADLRLIESYEHQPERQLSCPVIACAGLEDATVTDAGQAAWGQLTTGSFATHRFDGGHFYHLGPGEAELLRLISETLAGSFRADLPTT